MSDENVSPCPKCDSPYVYSMGALLVCPECAHEWNPTLALTEAQEDEDQLIVKDAHGTTLSDGDSVIVIKSLPVKGAPKPIKIGTKVTQIKLVAGDHNISCTVPGFGAMMLKSEFVKRA